MGLKDLIENLNVKRKYVIDKIRPEWDWKEHDPIYEKYAKYTDYDKIRPEWDWKSILPV